MVEGAGHDDIQPVILSVEAGKLFLRDPGDGVGVARVEFILFAERHFFGGVGAVLFGGADRKQAALQAEQSECFDEVEEDAVVVEKALLRSLPAVGDGAHCGEMDDPVGGELFQQRGEFRSAGQVELPVTDPHGFRSADRSDVDAEDFGIALLLQNMADQMLSDESAGAGDQNFFHGAI